MTRRSFVMLLFLAGLFMSFKDTLFEGFVKPNNFPDPVYSVTRSTITQESFELGRKLFYDPALSRGNKISCGFCHIQAAAFTQHGHDISHGIDDRLGSRNTPPIMNLAWSKSFFWDGGVFNLDMFPIAPITNHVEMDETMDSVIVKLQANWIYREKFKIVYGSDEINGYRIFKALSHFMLMCVSSDSKYDSVMRNTGVQFTASENTGYLVFKSKCSSCHSEPLFTDGSFRNNGLSNKCNPDSGRQAITLDLADRYKFKVPPLRNLSYTAPYMHDGRFISIDQVLNHYSNGVQESNTLDTLLRKEVKPGISLTSEEKADLKSFLKTLDDKNFITRRDLSEH